MIEFPSVEQSLRWELEGKQAQIDDLQAQIDDLQASLANTHGGVVMALRGYTPPTSLVVEELIDACMWFLKARDEGRNTDTYVEGIENVVSEIDRLYPRWRWSESLMPAEGHE